MVCFQYAVEVSPTLQNICSFLSENGWRMDIYTDALSREKQFTLPNTNIYNAESTVSTGLTPKELFCSFLKERLKGYAVVFAVDFIALQILDTIGFEIGKTIFISLEGPDFLKDFDRSFASRLINACAFSIVQSPERGIMVQDFLQTDIDFEYLPVSLRPKPIRQKQVPIRIVYSGYIVSWACLIEFLDCLNKLGVNNECELVLQGHAMGSETYLNEVKEWVKSMPNVKVDESYYKEERYHSMLAFFDLGLALYNNPSDSGNFENLIFSSGKIAAYLWNGLGVLTNINHPLTQNPPFIYLERLEPANLQNAIEFYRQDQKSFIESALALAREHYNFDNYFEKFIHRLVR